MTSARVMVRATPPPGGPPSPRLTMGVLVNSDSSDVSAPRGSGDDDDDDAPGPQPQMPIPDADAIISETMAEMEQARLKADQLICQFAEAYVATAGQLREGAIERYRERLEGLPADVAAKICETLAKDDIFCCNMEFGSGHMSFGGMSFTYKVDSDTAFNALSHHAWKDCESAPCCNGRFCHQLDLALFLELTSLTLSCSTSSLCEGQFLVSTSTR